MHYGDPLVSSDIRKKINVIRTSIRTYEIYKIRTYEFKFERTKLISYVRN